jgi:hypothetical protein
LASTYSVGADNSGIMTINAVQDIPSADNGTTSSSQWAIAMNSTGSEFRMVRIDDLGATPSGQNGTGHCIQATKADFTNTAAAAYSYAMQGETASTALPVAIVGRYNASGTSITAGAWNIGEAVAGLGFVSGTSAGTYTAPDTNGRFTSQTQPDGETTYWNHYVVYMIDSNRMFMLETDPISTTYTYWQQLLSGDVRKQLQTANTAADMLANPFVVYMQQFNTTTGYDSYIMQGTGNGSASSLAINQLYDDNNGSYTVGSAAGAGSSFTVAFDSSPCTTADCGTFATGATNVMYPFGNSNAFILGVNSSKGHLSTGWMEAQSGSFSDSTVAGTYMMGEMPLMKASQKDSVGEFDLLSSGNMNVNVSQAGQGVFTWDQPELSLTYAWDTSETAPGTFLIDQGSAGVFSCASISTTRAVCTAQTDSPKVIILQQ